MDKQKEYLDYVYNDLVTKQFETLKVLKTAKQIKEKYIEHLSEVRKFKNNEQQKMVQFYDEKYPDFKDSNPILLNGMITNTLDHKTLEKMIDMYKLFYEKKLSEHDASVKFGTVLVDKFVKPLLKK